MASPKELFSSGTVASSNNFWMLNSIVLYQQELITSKTVTAPSQFSSTSNGVLNENLSWGLSLGHISMSLVVLTALERLMYL